MSHGAEHSMAPADARRPPARRTSRPAGPSTTSPPATVVRRYLGNLVPLLGDIYPPAVVAKLADILGVEDDYPELQQKPSFAQVPNLVLTDALTPLDARARRRHEGVPPHDRRDRAGRSTSSSHRSRPSATTGRWPGPTIRVNQGDKVRAIFTNNLKETTGVHFHGVEFDDFFQDGVPFVTQKPIVPGEEYTYEFTANRRARSCTTRTTTPPTRSGAGCWARSSSTRRQPQTQYDREYIWISNDILGGFTINGHGFPAVVPVLAALGETGARPVHERGRDDASVAQPRLPDGARGPRRDPARERRARADTIGGRTRASAGTP